MSDKNKYTIKFPLIFDLLFLLSMSNRCCNVTSQHLGSPNSSTGVGSSFIRPVKTRHNVSLLLDKLLDDYNHHLRPDIGGPPTIVDVDIMVRSMGPVSEADMTFSLDCYFRQTWRDTRLAHQQVSKADDQLSLSVSMLDRIWKPDTYFYNGKNSYLHTITTPNKLVRLFPDGRILYSSRLTIKASCPMELRKFPMDVQLCPLSMGSFAYTQSEAIYRWNKDRQIVIAPGMKMSQFDLVSAPVSNYNISFKHGNHSMISVRFHLHRHMGSFLIQVYGPCILLVVLSWVSFWLNREATADRVSLGVTTVLTMTFLGLEARANLPKVTYPTALDHFIFLSFGFIFATIVQFAFVHYFTKYGFGELYFSEMAIDDDDEQLDNSDEVFPAAPPTPSPVVARKTKQVHPREVFSVESHLRSIKEEETAVVQIQPDERSNPSQRPRRRNQSRTQQWDGKAMNSVSKIDQISRIFFPALFIAINLFYWYTYATPASE
ncbi:gamma-aminobutyric acid receptor alpha-like [Daphnia magna]|uniref:gamma-aminobutyric acid receptor alpha-like n=1 Tax=Daphnia magna TaxID=35525 RepID=UPI001E1BBF26|nr:gamma-aminobutyric acid receptor alpha-like [Daphnia magna]XP_045031045.1 gamma-aminobutyric acid receptor alpha-like [Daphnia magna]XP_045031046.1 gamma-aminobutyric acid receptor alpha-like [Daphnia magna]